MLATVEYPTEQNAFKTIVMMRRDFYKLWKTLTYAALSDVMLPDIA